MAQPIFLNAGAHLRGAMAGGPIEASLPLSWTEVLIAACDRAMGKARTRPIKPARPPVMDYLAYGSVERQTLGPL